MMPMRVDEAAKLLGMNTQTLRLGLRQNLFPFGSAVLTSKNRYTYYINPTRLERYLKGEDMYIKDTDNCHCYGNDHNRCNYSC